LIVIKLLFNIIQVIIYLIIKFIWNILRDCIKDKMLEWLWGLIYLILGRKIQENLGIDLNIYGVVIINFIISLLNFMKFVFNLIIFG
jgi:hypothetical protein